MDKNAVTQAPEELTTAETKIQQLEQMLAEEQKLREKTAKEAAKLMKEKDELTKEKVELTQQLQEAQTPAPVEEPKKADEMVTIKLFKDNKDYKDDLTVLVNGTAYKIQRGVPVPVPAYVAEVIEHSATQDAKTAELIEKLVEDTIKSEPK